MKPLAVATRIVSLTMLAHGRNDRVILSAVSDYSACYILHTSHIVYDHCGHAPFLAQVSQFNCDIAASLEVPPSVAYGEMGA